MPFFENSLGGSSAQPILCPAQMQPDSWRAANFFEPWPLQQRDEADTSSQTQYNASVGGFAEDKICCNTRVTLHQTAEGLSGSTSCCAAMRHLNGQRIHWGTRQACRHAAAHGWAHNVEFNPAQYTICKHRAFNTDSSMQLAKASTQHCACVKPKCRCRADAGHSV